MQLLRASVGSAVQHFTQTKPLSRLPLSSLSRSLSPSDDPTAAVLYVYEVQLAAGVQRSGLGQHLMRLVELVALHARMPHVMLTVFKSNAAAMALYRQKLNYQIDASSPSRCGNGACPYEILSLDLAARDAETAVGKAAAAAACAEATVVAAQAAQAAGVAAAAAAAAAPTGAEKAPPPELQQKLQEQGEAPGTADGDGTQPAKELGLASGSLKIQPIVA